MSAEEQTKIPDEDIVAEIRMPDCAGNTCLTFILGKYGDVHCWPDFGDPVRVDPEVLQAVADAISILTKLCPSWQDSPGKTFEEVVHGR